MNGKGLLFSVWLFCKVLSRLCGVFILKIWQNTPTSKRSEGGEMNTDRFCVNK